MKPIAEFEIVDHGIEHPDYFQGCGTSFTRFDDVATGIGECPADAIDDAIESLAENWNVDSLESRILAEIGKKTLPRSPKAKGEAWYHVSIRVR